MWRVVLEHPNLTLALAIGLGLILGLMVLALRWVVLSNLLFRKRGYAVKWLGENEHVYEEADVVPVMFYSSLGHDVLEAWGLVRRQPTKRARLLDLIRFSGRVSYVALRSLSSFNTVQ